MNVILWLLLFIILVAFELFTMGLTTIWFAVGSLVAFFAALFHATWWIQFVLFIVISFIMLVFTRPFAIKYINKGTVKTNVDSLIGMKAKVVQKIDNAQAQGYVTINGMEWAARSEDGNVIDEGALVTVKQVAGVKVIVSEE